MMKNTQALRILRQTKRNYNTIALDWNVSRGRPSALKISLLKGIKPGYRVLDLGCGNGFLAPEVIKRGAEYVGIDVSSKLIRIAKKKFVDEVKSGKAKFICADVLNLKLPNKTFDFIFSFAVMHHIPSNRFRLNFLKQIYKLLKPGARAVVVNWNLLNQWTNQRFNITEQLKEISADFDTGDVVVPWKATEGRVVKRYLHWFSDEELSSLTKKAGFKSSRIEYRDRSGKRKKNGEEQILLIKKSSAQG